MDFRRYLLVSAAAFILADCGGGQTPPSISGQPQATSVAEGAVAVLTVVANGSGPLTYQWSKNASVISGATSATYLTEPVTQTDSGAVYSVVVTGPGGNVKSANATLTVFTPSPVDVLTFHNDVARTGQNLGEMRLTTGNVTQAHFGKIGIFAADGKIDAQPLVVSGLAINGSPHNVVYIATEHDTVYAYDVDSGDLIWRTSLLPPGSGEQPSDPIGCNLIVPEIGVTATPVIDRSRGAIYLVAMSNNASTGTYYQRLHALSLTTGTEMFGGPTAVPTTFAGQPQTFNPMQYAERAALLLANNKVYTSWTSHCDQLPYGSWVIAFDASTLQVTHIFDGEPGDPNGAGSFWNAGSGPAADANGNVYLVSANGTFDTTPDADGFPEFQDYGNSFIKLAPPAATSSTLQLQDYFSMYNSAYESEHDQDLGSGGVMLLPDVTDATGTVRHLAVGAGKDNNVYLVNRDNMGKFQPTDNSQIWQELINAFPNSQFGIFGAPAYFDGKIYYAPVNDAIYAFSLNDAKMASSAITRTKLPLAYPGATFSISANGAKNGILWAMENSATQGVLHAFDAEDLTNELYNSSQAGSRDTFGPGSKFTPPTIANGKVFVVTQIDLTNNASGAKEGVVEFGAF